MKLIAILLLITITTANVFKGFKLKDTTCKANVCTEAAEAMYKKCGTTDTESNYACVCKMPNSFFADMISCYKSCGIIGDSDAYTVANFKSEVCKLARSSSSSSKSSTKSSSSSTSPNTSEREEAVSNIASSGSIVSFVGLIAAMLI